MPQDGMRKRDKASIIADAIEHIRHCHEMLNSKPIKLFCEDETLDKPEPNPYETPDLDYFPVLLIHFLSKLLPNLQLKQTTLTSYQRHTIYS